MDYSVHTELKCEIHIFIYTECTTKVYKKLNVKLLFLKLNETIKQKLSENFCLLHLQPLSIKDNIDEINFF